MNNLLLPDFVGTCMCDRGPRYEREWICSRRGCGSGRICDAPCTVVMAAVMAVAVMSSALRMVHYRNNGHI